MRTCDSATGKWDGNHFSKKRMCWCHHTVWRRRCTKENAPVADLQWQVRWHFKSALHLFHYLAWWGIAERVGMGPDGVSKLESDLWPLQGSDSDPQVSSNETPFHQRGSSRPWWEVLSDGGCRRPLRRWPAASPALALSSATHWKEWLR